MLFSFLRLKFYEFLLFYALFVPPFPRSPYVYTAIARQPTVSALNQASPGKALRGEAPAIAEPIPLILSPQESYAP